MAAKYPIRLSGIKVIDAKYSDIEVGERFRKELGDVAAFAQNLTKEGLINPIAVRETPNAEKPYELVAGGRRHAAIGLIAEKTGQGGDLLVSIRIYDKDLSDYELRVLEYSENLYRKDLTWQEKIKLEAKIHSFQMEIHGKKTSTAKDAPGWSQNQTAELMGKSVGKISEDLKLAKMMEDLPEVDWSKFKTQSDVNKAIKIAGKTVEQKRAAEQAEKILKTGDDRKRVLIDAYKVGDFFDEVKKVGDGTISLCEIDPPYAIDLEAKKRGYGNSKYSGYNEIDAEKYPDFMTRTLKECYRVMKTDSWLIVWFGPDPWFEPMYNWISQAGFKVSRLVGIWSKGECDDDGCVQRALGQTMAPEYVLANSYEMFFYARKGNSTIQLPGTPNTLGYRPVPAAHKYHPTERPKELMQHLLRIFGKTNDKVLVPFAGSGRTLLEAAKLSMIPIGFDLTKEYRDGYIIKVHQEI